MADVMNALERVTARVAADADMMVADPVLMRRVASAPALAQLGQVIPIAAGTGELSLSSLMAQLSGEGDLGGQDDAVLELGFQRLTGPGRTILVVQAPHGVGRTALRYLQHVTRLAPRLSLVVSGSAALDALLAEPGFAALNARLEVAPATDAPAAQALAVIAAPQPAGSALTPRRGPALWTGAALGAAAVAGVAWFSFGALRAAGSAVDGVKVEAAISVAPPLAALADPALVSVPSPVLASAAAPTLAVLPSVAGAEKPTGPRRLAAALPPLATAHHPVLASALPLPLLLKPALRPHRPEAARLPRRDPNWPPPPRYEAPDFYADVPYPQPMPAWARREARRRETPYLGTFAVDPYGFRVFRYDP